MIFVNLAVADVEKSVAFYQALGFTKDDRFSQPGTAASMQWSDTIVLMILDKAFFQTFIPHKAIADSATTAEALLCLSLDSREDVDRFVEAAGEAGGRIDFRPVQDMGFMYGRAFEDLDGHIFEPMYMDLDAALAAFAQQGEAAGV
ncbi:VOC family protein [Sphingomonas sp.]|uniref:VOC family protein n=1 Tax=Sphingomonas sp. TaxID=28214 RepID=UPI002C3B106F|nr:VOC family protein [Sphingomonas sp.]HWK34960.1 VOC family protein [Sphingomonas sp.]